MLEELGIQASQHLTVLFWIIIAFIFVAAVAAAKSDKKAKP